MASPRKLGSWVLVGLGVVAVPTACGFGCSVVNQFDDVAPGVTGTGGSAGATSTTTTTDTTSTSSTTSTTTTTTVGPTCTTVEECGATADHCVDGYCCDAACTEDCKACNVAGLLGTCSFTAGDSADCATGFCDGTGSCAVGNVLWSKRYNDVLEQWAQATAVDSTGNMIFVGNFNATLTFIVGQQLSAAWSDVYVAKFNSSGAVQWSKQVGDANGTMPQFSDSVCVDPQNNIWVVGSYEGAFSSLPAPAANTFHVFVSKFGPSGSPVTTKSFATSTTDAGLLMIFASPRCATDAAGNVYITGTVQQASVNWGDGARDGTTIDTFLIKLSNDTTLAWSKRFNGSAVDGGRAVAVDAAGNIYVAGAFGGAIDFGAGQIVAAAGSDAFLAKFDSSGTNLWSKPLGGTGTDSAVSLALGKDGGPIVGGFFQNDADFGGGVRSATGEFQMLLASYDPDGNYQWDLNAGPSVNSGAARRLAVDSAGRVIVVGDFIGTASFGGNTFPGSANPNDYEAFLLKLSPRGEHVWSRAYITSKAESFLGVAVAPQDNIVVTGQFINPIDIGGSLPGAGDGYNDVVMAKFSP